jgi:hypothetical protein
MQSHLPPTGWQRAALNHAQIGAALYHHLVRKDRILIGLVSNICRNGRGEAKNE